MRPTVTGLSMPGAPAAAASRSPVATTARAPETESAWTAISGTEISRGRAPGGHFQFSGTRRSVMATAARASARTGRASSIFSRRPVSPSTVRYSKPFVLPLTVTCVSSQPLSREGSSNDMSNISRATAETSNDADNARCLSVTVTNCLSRLSRRRSVVAVSNCTDQSSPQW